MTKKYRTRNTPPPTPANIIGAILAQGVIRLLERQKHLAELTEERVHGGLLPTQETTHD